MRSGACRSRGRISRRVCGWRSRWILHSYVYTGSSNATNIIRLGDSRITTHAPLSAPIVSHKCVRPVSGQFVAHSQNRMVQRTWTVLAIRILVYSRFVKVKILRAGVNGHRNGSHGPQSIVERLHQITGIGLESLMGYGFHTQRRVNPLFFPPQKKKKNSIQTSADDIFHCSVKCVQLTTGGASF